MFKTCSHLIQLKTVDEDSPKSTEIVVNAPTPIKQRSLTIAVFFRFLILKYENVCRFRHGHQHGTHDFDVDCYNKKTNFF